MLLAFLLFVPPTTHVVDELLVVDIGATIDETASNPRDNFNISAPNWCNAVIVDGVGSGMLWMRVKRKMLLLFFLRLIKI